MHDANSAEQRPVWIRRLPLQQRWGMPASTLYHLISKGRAPKPEYPFGPSTPYWRLSVIEAFERQAGREAA